VQELRKKLAEIRKRLEVTQEEMAKRLIQRGAERTNSSGAAADFETGKRSPPY
jgi:transcriptional regulator with XRE-family HTH domain